MESVGDAVVEADESELHRRADAVLVVARIADDRAAVRRAREILRGKRRGAGHVGAGEDLDPIIFAARAAPRDIVVAIGRAVGAVAVDAVEVASRGAERSEEPTSALKSLVRIS